MYELVIKQGYRETTFVFKSWLKLTDFAQEVLNSCVENGIEIVIRPPKGPEEPALEDGFDSEIVTD